MIARLNSGFKLIFMLQRHT